jgi:hypothetical protein
MAKTCPFIVGQSCIEHECAVWRLPADAPGYCGAGGPPPVATVPVASAPVDVVEEQDVRAAIASTKPKRTQ